MSIAVANSVLPKAGSSARGILLFCAVALGGFAPVTMAFAAAENDTAAQVLTRGAVDYPSACMPEDRSISDDSVTVAYTVTKSGVTTGMRVRESTNSCFNDVALAAVAATRYKPRTLKGKPVEQEDVESTFRFKFDESLEIPPPVETEDFDARPLVRVPPNYPSRCMADAKSRETILLSFDVNEVGRTENIRVEISTNPCLNRSAINSVEKWKYEPRRRDGVPVRRDNVQATVIYQLAGGRLPAEERVRPAVLRALENVSKMLRNERPPQEILEALEELEREYGEDFSSIERGGFHQLRGVARLKNGDYEGALDDLKIAENLLAHEPETSESIRRLIEQLEAAGVGAATVDEEQ